MNSAHHQVIPKGMWINYRDQRQNASAPLRAAGGFSVGAGRVRRVAVAGPDDDVRIWQAGHVVVSGLVFLQHLWTQKRKVPVPCVMAVTSASGTPASLCPGSACALCSSSICGDACQQGVGIVSQLVTSAQGAPGRIRRRPCVAAAGWENTSHRTQGSHAAAVLRICRRDAPLGRETEGRQA